MKLDSARVRRAVQQIQAQFIENASAHRVFTLLLLEVMEISGSDVGFVVEVSASEEPRLKPLAVSAQWAVNSRQFGIPDSGWEAYVLGMDALLAAVAADGRAVVPPNAAAAPEPDATPAQALRSMTGFPLNCGGELVGLMGLGGLTQAAVQVGAGHLGAGPPQAMLAELLRPLLDTGAFLIQSYRSARRVDSLRTPAVRLTQAGADMACVIGLDGYLKRADPALVALLGYSEAELMDLPLEHWVLPRDRAALTRALEQLKRGEPLVDLQLQFLPRNGGPVWLCWRAAADPGQQAAYALARNIPPQWAPGARQPELVAQTQARVTDPRERIPVENSRG